MEYTERSNEEISDKEKDYIMHMYQKYGREDVFEALIEDSEDNYNEKEKE